MRLLVVAIVCFIAFASGQVINQRGHSTEIVPWAQALADYFTDAASTLKTPEIQQLYDEATYAAEDRNPEELSERLKEFIENIFNKKTASAERIAEQVRTSWSAYQANPSSVVKSDWYDSSDVNKLPTKLADDTRFPNVAGGIDNSTSVIKIASTVTLGEVEDAIHWSDSLNDIFVENLQNDDSLKWQYFGSVVGLHRTYPGKEWSHKVVNQNKVYNNYDPRFRPWFVEASSGAKNVIILLDVSGSMTINGRIDFAKQAANTVIDTLTEKDFFNVIAFRDQAFFVSCLNTYLVRGSSSNRALFKEAISELRAEGGTNFEAGFQEVFNLLDRTFAQHNPDENIITHSACLTSILFLTDGNSIDPEDLIKEYQETHPKNNVKVFSYTMGNNIDRRIPQKLACDLSIGTYNHIREGGDLTTIMGLYYTFMAEGVSVWSAPYFDASGLGVMVTRAIPVYVGREFIGTVGVDITLNEIDQQTRNFMESYFSESSYAFVITGEGKTVIHPRTRALKNPIFRDIAELEMIDGEPQAFLQDVRRPMLFKNTGTVVIDGAPQVIPRGNSLESGYRVKFVRKTYSYRPVTGTDFAVCIVIPENISYNLNPKQDFSSQEPKIVYHRLSFYQTVPLTLSPSHKGQPILNVPGRTAVQVSPFGFCNPSAYLTKEKESNEDIERVLEQLGNTTFDPLQKCPPPSSTDTTTIKSQVSGTVQWTQAIDELWTAEPFRDDVAFMYFGAEDGVFRIYPGIQIFKTYDHTRRPWYLRSLAFPSQTAVSVPYFDETAKDTVITISRSVFQGCRASNNGSSPSCVHTPESDSVAGVAGADVYYTSFWEYVYGPTGVLGLPFEDESKSCTNPNNLCYVIDNHGYLIVHPDYSPDNYTSKFFGEKETPLLQELIKLGVFYQDDSEDFFSGCDIESSTSKRDFNTVFNSFSDGGNEDTTNLENCIKQIKIYTLNSTVLPEGKVITSALNTRCQSAFFTITNIKGTNLYLVTLLDNKNLVDDTSQQCDVILPTVTQKDLAPCDQDPTKEFQRILPTCNRRVDVPCAKTCPGTSEDGFTVCSGRGDCFNGRCLCGINEGVVMNGTDCSHGFMPKSNLWILILGVLAVIASIVL
eukprot:CAMPEP_0168534572 /NCGR_PEP_ID=MMETSP0405-20121227/18023_1 /TAXON_ID=498012 /ORGANISM="Trichosphaerium sp, Strain Am-I-7 wt" /LENGTH=1106 /DNA_ID=CAMNT_0008561391 /DNA_START=25 /DNA_END=3345 /DNA_ORIENTATION=-